MKKVKHCHLWPDVMHFRDWRVVNCVRCAYLSDCYFERTVTSLMTDPGKYIPDDCVEGMGVQPGKYLWMCKGWKEGTGEAARRTQYAKDRFSVAEVAKVFGVDPRKVSGWINSNYVRPLGRERPGRGRGHTFDRNEVYNIGMFILLINNGFTHRAARELVSSLPNMSWDDARFHYPARVECIEIVLHREPLDAWVNAMIAMNIFGEGGK